MKGSYPYCKPIIIKYIHRPSTHTFMAVWVSLRRQWEVAGVWLGAGAAAAAVTAVCCLGWARTWGEPGAGGRRCSALTLLVCGVDAGLAIGGEAGVACLRVPLASSALQVGSRQMQ